MKILPPPSLLQLTKRVIVKSAAVLMLLFGVGNSSYSQNWSLNGPHIYNNNPENVGIGAQNPTGMLEISTLLSGYNETITSSYECISGKPGLIINGKTFDLLPNYPFFNCSAPIPSPNLVEINLQEGSYTPSIGGGNGFGGTFNYTTIRRVTVNNQGQLGVGDNLDPTADIDVEGNIRMRNGAQNGYVATSSASGVMTWQPAGAGSFWEQIPGSTAGYIRNKTNGEVHIGNVNHALFLDPYLGGGDYRHHSKDGDVGIFFAPTKDEEGTTFNEPGLVIGPRNFNDGWAGLRMDWDGNVCIGCDVGATGFKLSVNGNIMAELVQVKLKSNWPDYVFEEHYDLKPLSEVETYINENGHLEGMPIASEVSKEGIDLGEMNRLLLEKVEELTLYVIELEKKMKEGE